jgi:hypothetical protein
MKIGIIISMYDEIETTQNSIISLKQEECPIVVIQSDPNDPLKTLSGSSVDFYEKLPDLAGSTDKYLKERSDGKDATTPVRALTRNFRKAFLASQTFNVDWWVVILGDVLLEELSGIKNIIKKMLQAKKSLGITCAVGQTFKDDDNNSTRIQYENTTDFMPQFFIVNSNLVRNGLFSKFEISNRFTTEQCLGDEVNRYCLENNITFGEISFRISNYAYPQFITGLVYNTDRVSMPRYVDGFVNMLRRFKIKYSK